MGANDPQPPRAARSLLRMGRSNPPCGRDVILEETRYGVPTMARRQSKEQKETIERVMHEFKHGELRIRGSGPKVKIPSRPLPSRSMRLAPRTRKARRRAAKP